MRTIIALLVSLIAFEKLPAQPMIPEDRNYFTLSTDVILFEQDIYLPSLSAEKPSRFVRWVYQYDQGKLTEERSYAKNNLQDYEFRKRWVYYNGKLVSDSSRFPSQPLSNAFASYEYDEKGRLLKVTQIDLAKWTPNRTDVYHKYRAEGSFQVQSQFYGDDGKPSVSYTSMFEKGRKTSVSFGGRFPPLSYSYDEAGRLTAINDKKFLYKTDARGNPIAVVITQRGLRTYHFFRITYRDGTITGTLDPDTALFSEMANMK